MSAQENLVNDVTEKRGMAGMGWLPDYPDLRDYTPAHDKISPC